MLLTRGGDRLQCPGERLLVLLVVVLLAAAKPATAADWLAGALLAGARERLEAGDVAGARDRLEELVAAHPEEARGHYALVWCHLELGELDAAAAVAERAVAEHGDLGYAHAALGDVRLFLGDFDGALSAYGAAVEADRTVAVAQYGLGVLYRAERRMVSARRQFETAYRLDPTDFRILLAMASASVERSTRLVLLREAVTRALGLDAQERSALDGRLAVLSALEAGEGECRLAGEGGSYEVPLRRLRSGPKSAVRFGIHLTASGGKKTVALLDSGASGVTLSESYAEKLELEILGRSAMQGLGEEGMRATTVARVPRLELGGVLFEDCLVDVVANRHLAEDALVGLDGLKNDFEITLDFGEARMRLEPLPPLPTDEKGRSDPYGYERSVEKLARGYLPVRVFGGDLLVPVIVDETELSYLVLDSGATETVLATRLAAKLGPLRPSGKQVKGISGRIGGVREVAAVQLRIGSVAQTLERVPAIDLDHYAARTGYGVGGLLGQSMLEGALVVLDYRNALARFDLAAVRRRPER